MLMILVRIPGYAEMKIGCIRATFVLATTVMSGLAGAQDADPVDLHATHDDSYQSRSKVGQFLDNLFAGPGSASLDKWGGENRLTLGDRFWIGPRWEGRTGNDGTFPVKGEIDGLVLGARSRNVDATFISMEAIWLNGAFELTSGDLTDYNEFQLETLVGKTWEHKTNLFVTPYTGLRYRNADNLLRSANFNADVTQNRWDAPFGIRSDYLFSDNIAVGVDSRLQWKFQDKQVVSFTGTTLPDLPQDTKNRLTYRIEVPITFRLGSHSELALRPYYEWDRFDATDESRSTRIREDGIDLTYLITF